MKLLTNVAQAIARCRDDGLKGCARYVKRRAIAKQKGYPHTITFEASSVCNLRCVFCYIMKAPIERGRKFLPLGTFKKVVDESRHFLEEAMLHWRGEPLLNKDMPDMVLFASERGIRSSFSTNGLLLTKELSRRLIFNRLACITFCLDGVTQDVYGLHRCGGDLDVLLQNIRDLVGLKKTMRSRYPRVDLQMIVTKKNQHQVDAFGKLARGLGVDSAYLMSLFIDKTAREDEFVKRMEEEFFVESGQEGLSRYFLDEAGKVTLYGAATLCPQDAKYPVVTCDGDVVGCCYDIFLTYNFGNCERDSFPALWENSRYARFRKDEMMARRLAICKNCMPKNREWTYRLF